MGSLARRPLDPLDMNAQGLEFLTDDALRHAPAQILHQKSHKALLHERECVKTHTLSTSRDRSALAAALKLLSVDGTTISYSAVHWVVRPPWQDTRKKSRVSRTPDIKMGDLLRTLPCW